MASRTLSRQPAYRSSSSYAVQVGNLDIPDPGMIGRATQETVADHAKSNVSSDYSYAPVIATDASLSIPLRLRGPRSKIGMRNPYTLQPYVRPDTKPGIPAQTTSGNAGSEGYDNEVVQHGPWTGADAINMGVAKNQPWWRKFLGLRTKAQDATLTGTGAAQDVTTGQARYVRSAAELGQNTFLPPDVRATWDTPAAPGIPLDPYGRPTVKKAGVPLPDPEDNFAREGVQTGYTQMSIGGGHGTAANDDGGVFLPIPVRPANMPSGFYQFDRKWDMWATHQLTGSKGVMSSPIAGMPLMTTSEQVQAGSGAGSHGGDQSVTPAPGMIPFGPSPNTVRQVPQSWDYDLNLQTAGVTVGRSRRSLRY